MFGKKSVLVASILAYSLLQAMGAVGIERGKILSSTSIPIVLSPASGYVKYKGDGTKEGKWGLQEYYNTPLSQGKNLYTSIDETLQKAVDDITNQAKEHLGATEVLAMVMESHTGKMVALSSSNRYNPTHITLSDIDSLIPQFAHFTYEPGAVMMPFTVAMALETHPDTKEPEKEKFNTDYDAFPIGNGMTISDSHKYKSQTMSDIIVHSSNIGIAKIATTLGGDTIYNALTKDGFGEKSGIDLARESTGLLKSKQQLNSKPNKVTTAYGYGIAVTPVQLLKAYSIFSNAGKIVTPHIGIVESNQTTSALSAINANRVKQMLIENVQRGTAQAAKMEGLTIGGKTGTAHRVKKGRYVNRYNSSFYGFVEDGIGHHYTIGVVVINPGQEANYLASHTAVPVFRKIVEAMAAQRLLVKQSNSKEKLAHYNGKKTIAPLKGATVQKPFGFYVDKAYGIKVFNESVILKAAHPNASVMAVLDGKVVFAGKSHMLGNVVVVAHPNKIHAVYAGLSDIAPSMRPGHVVHKGEVVGRVKKRLIFQVTQNAKIVNPLDIITVDRGEGYSIGTFKTSCNDTFSTRVPCSYDTIPRRLFNTERTQYDCKVGAT